MKPKKKPVETKQSDNDNYNYKYMHEQSGPRLGEHTRSQSKLELKETAPLINIASSDREIAKTRPQESRILRGKGGDLPSKGKRKSLLHAHNLLVEVSGPIIKDPRIKSLDVPPRNPMINTASPERLQNSALRSVFSGSKERGAISNDISRGVTAAKGVGSNLPSSEYKSGPLLAYHPTHSLTEAAAAGIAAVLGSVARLWGKFRQEQDIDDGMTGDEVTEAIESKRLHPRAWRHDTQLCIRL
jgi:hypothetical protein